MTSYIMVQHYIGLRPFLDIHVFSLIKKVFGKQDEKRKGKRTFFGPLEFLARFACLSSYQVSINLT